MREGKRRSRLSSGLAFYGSAVVIVVAGLASCADDPEGTDVGERDLLYVAGCEKVQPRIQRYDVKTGEYVPGFSPAETCLSADVDPEGGRVFIYTYGYLRSYTDDGELLHEKEVETHIESGREFIAYDSRRRRVYLLDGLGGLTAFNAGNLDVVDYTDTSLVDVKEFYFQLVASRIWMVSRDRRELRGYDFGSIIRVYDNGIFWRPVFESHTGTITIGTTKTNGYFLTRISLGLKRYPDIQVGIVPRYLAVEPVTGILWVSDGEVTERYTTEGEKLAEPPTRGFKFLIFDYIGSAAFGVDPAGRFYAIRTDDLQPLWSARGFSPDHDIFMLKYAPH